MKNTLINIWLLSLFLISCSTPVPTTREPNSTNDRLDYPKIFEASRNILIPQDKTVKGLTESQVVEELQNHPEFLMLAKADLVQAVKDNQDAVDPTKHTRLIPPHGLPGYTDLRIYVNHPYYDQGKLVPKSDLIATWKAFLRSAQKEIILNVFDFDLEDVADVLIERAKKGVNVRVGIDQKNVISVRPEVKLVYDKLLAGGVKVTGVMPVGLSHQKMTAIDWSLPNKASVLFSSGNLTKSCLELDGDLKGTVPLPKESVPNANHFITMKSWLLANLVNHELTKTLDPKYLLRGKAYPINGSYQVTGPGVDPYTLEAYPEPSLVISFTPGGGMKSINKNIISHFIKKETGRIRMLQFAYSSIEVDSALLSRAQLDYQTKKKFDFLSVGDTPFAMMEWSKFLNMSGIKRTVDEKKVKHFDPDPNNAWVKGLTPAQLADVQRKVYIAPKVYANNFALVQGKKVKVNAKIHHKVLATDTFAILGTSFNFSEGAESNNEQILVFKNKKLADIVDGMVRYMVENSPGTVAAEAKRRDKSFGSDEDGDVESTSVK